MATVCEQANFDCPLTNKLKSYLEGHQRLKDIVREEDKLMYGSREAGRLGQAVSIRLC